MLSVTGLAQILELSQIRLHGSVPDHSCRILAPCAQGTRILTAPLKEEQQRGRKEDMQAKVD